MRVILSTKKKCKVCKEVLCFSKFTKCGKKFKAKTSLYVQQYRAECLDCWAKKERTRWKAKKEAKDVKLKA